MNFDKLPSDIKQMIFNINRVDATTTGNKKQYDEVMYELKGLREFSSYSTLRNIRDYNDCLNQEIGGYYDDDDDVYDDYSQYCREQYIQMVRE